MSSVVIYVCVHASVCMYAYTYNNKVHEEEVMRGWESREGHGMSWRGEKQGRKLYKCSTHILNSQKIKF